MRSVFFALLCVILSVAKDLLPIEIRSDSEFETAVSFKEISVVLFYAPRCRFCQAVFPVWNDVAKQLVSDARIQILQVDASKYTDIGVKHGITGYPFVKLFLKDREIFDYPMQMPRSVSAYINWINKHIDRVHKLENSVDSFLAENKFCVFGVESEMTTKNEFIAVSRHFEEVAFALISSDAAIKIRSKHTELVSSIFMFKDKQPVGSFKGGNSQDLDIFVRGNILPAVTHFSFATAESIFSIGLPVLILFSDDSIDSENVKNIFQQVAKLFAGRLVSVSSSMDNNIEQKLASMVGSENIPMPFVRILDGSIDESHKYRDHEGLEGVLRHRRKHKPDTTELTTKTIAEFADQFLLGKSLPFIKSEPIPEPAKRGEVMTVVGDTFESLVLKSDKSVLITLYASWCGHCRVMIPTWNALAKKLQDVENVVIARLEATLNELPFNIRSYPTILLFRPQERNTAVQYTGDGRDIDDFVDFLQRADALTSNFDISESVSSRTMIGSEL